MNHIFGKNCNCHFYWFKNDLAFYLNRFSSLSSINQSSVFVKWPIMLCRSLIYRDSVFCRHYSHPITSSLFMHVCVILYTCNVCTCTYGSTYMYTLLGSPLNIGNFISWETRGVFSSFQLVFPGMCGVPLLLLVPVYIG